MLNLIRNEIFKTYRLIKIYLFLCVIAAIEIASILQHHSSQTEAMMNGQSFPLAFLNYLPQIMIVLIAVFIADNLVDEYRSGAMKLVLLRPVTRKEWIHAKIVSLLLFIAAMTAYTVLSSYVIGTLALGWGDHTVVGGITYTTGEGIGITLRAMLSSMLPGLGLGIIVVWIALFTTSIGATIGVPLGLMAISPMLETTRFSKDCSIVYQMVHFHGNVIVKGGSGEALTGLFCSTVYIGVFYIGSVMIIRKKDLFM